MSQQINSNKTYLRIIIVISVTIPLAVAALLFLPFNFSVDSQSWIRSLPTFNAVINSLTAVLLISALVAIKRKNVTLHRNLMMAALALGTLFLLSYVVYHASSSSTVFGDMDHDGALSEAEANEVGQMRVVYLITLLSHIGLSIVVVPFVLFAFYFALTDQIRRHRKIVKFTFPIWLYVSITGVIVYLLISPYYI